MVTLLHCEAAAADHAMETADPEFPAPVDPPPADVSEEKLATSKSFRPRLPVIFYRLLPRARLRAVGQYIASFEYWLHPQTNFNSQKQRPLFLIMETAKSIVNAPQPIKCVEAVFVALLLTAGLPDVERFPLSFQTVLDDQVYQHIVLLVQYLGKFGAFGISRWPEFMSKDLKFDSMSSVVENYKTAYEGQHHVVEKIRVGLPVEHNTRSTNFVCWRHLELDLEDQSWKECCEAIDEFAGKAKRLWNLWIRSGKGENPWQLYIRQTTRLLANRKPSPPKTAKPADSVEFADVNCRFNIQPPSSRESARITLSLEPGEVIFPPKSKKAAVVQKEFCFNPMRSQLSKPRRSKRSSKEDVVARSVERIRGAIRSLPRAVAQKQSVEPPLVVSQCLLGTKYLDGTPGFDGPKACWECLRTVYRTRNEARLLLLKDKLSDLRTQGPLVGECFRVVQDIFQKLVGIGDAITSKLDGFEGTINALTDSFDAVVQSVNGQNELHSLKQLAQQLTEEMEPIQVTEPIKRKKAMIHETAKRSSLKKIEEPQAPPPCNWCGVFGHRMRDCKDLETEIARRVREYKNQVDSTLPNSSRGDDQSESHNQSDKLVLWHKNRSKLQDQNCSDSQRPNDSVDMGSLPEVDMDQRTTPSATTTTTTTTARTTKKKMSLVQRRLRTKLMYLLGMNNKPAPQVKSHGNRRKTNPKKKPLQF